MYLIAALAVLGFFLGHVESYAYDNKTLRCPNETVGDPFLVKQLQKNFTKVRSFGGNDVYSELCTTGVVTMGQLFKDKPTFNQDISHWDTSSVTDMNNMFFGAEAFDSDISNWDTSNVEDMDSMFVGAYKFNSDISKWDTSRVTNMNSMFYLAVAFNRDLSGWCVPLIPTEDNFFAADSPLADNINFHPKWNGTGCTTTTTTGTTTTATTTTTTPDPTTTDDDTEPPVLAMILGSVGIGIVLSLGGYFVYKKRQPKTSIAFGPP
jgi:surface protein